MQPNMQRRITATGRAMSEPPTDSRSPAAELLRDMAAALGIALSDERAAALAEQAGPHFAILHALDTIAEPGTEPAATFRLDDWRGGPDG